MQIMFLPHRKPTYRPPRPLPGIALLFYMQIIFVLHRKHFHRIPGPVPGIALFLYTDYVRTSQETHLWASTGCYGDSLTLLYANDVRTSHETYIGLHGMLQGWPYPFICKRCSYLTRNIHRPPRHVTGIALTSYM
jgi:hypothetical protein